MSRNYLEALNRRDVARVWFLIAVGSLLISGALAFFTAIARTPVIASFFTDTDFFRRVLVVHVVLGVAVWFTALPVTFFQLLQEDRPCDFLSRLSASVAVAGILLMVFTSFSHIGSPYLSNYIPVISHPLFIVGLFFYLAGVAFNYFNAGLIGPTSAPGLAPAALPAPKKNLYLSTLTDLQAGVRLGALYFLVSLVTILLSAIVMPGGFQGQTHFEVMMWGGGHVLQFANVTFMLVCWTISLTTWRGKAILSRVEAFILFLWMGLPVFVTPLLAGQNVIGPAYREGFTLLMRWGIFPPVLFYLFYVGRRLLKEVKTKDFFSDGRPLMFILSAFLILTGFVFGALVRGPDLRLPGHYHASIGAVTISFMGAAYGLLRQFNIFEDREFRRLRTRVQLYLYGIGQFVFATGMFVAGSYGMSRKVYGIEQQIRNTGQTVGMWIMGIGGLFALSGGFYFVFLVFSAVLKHRREVASKTSGAIQAFFRVTE